MPNLRNGDRTRYVASYVSLSALACIITGLAFLLFSAATLRNTLNADYDNRTALAKEELRKQMVVLDDIEKRIKCRLCYVPAYKNSAYMHRRELVEDLKECSSLLPYDYDCILVYRDEEDAYTDSARLSFKQLVTHHLQIRDEAFFTGAALSGSGDRVMREGSMLVLFRPFRLFTAGTMSNVCIVLRIPEKSLRMRLSVISGLPLSALSLDVTPDGLAVTTRYADLYGSLNAFGRVCAYIWAALLSVVLAAAISGGVRRYQPIARLSKKLGVNGGTNVFDSIETRMLATFEENDTLRASLMEKVNHIDRQADTIRTQCLSLVLKGIYDANTLERLHIAFEGSVFAVFVACRGERATAWDVGKAASDLEGVTHHTVPFETENRVAVILNAHDAETLRRATSLLEERLGDGCATGVGALCDSAKGLSGSYANALRKLTTDICGREELTRLLAEALREDDRDAAHRIVMRIGEILSESGITPSQRRGTFVEMAGLLAQKVGDLNATQLAQAQDVERFVQALDTITCALCADREEACNEQDIIRFIDEHAMEYTMSLDYLESRFRLCGKTIGAAVKRATGMRFREYLVHLRMERAKLLLRDTDFSVAKIAEMSGYGSVSYFNRAFKETMGTTPGKYQQARQDYRAHPMDTIPNASN